MEAKTVLENDSTAAMGELSSDVCNCGNSVKVKQKVLALFGRTDEDSEDACMARKRIQDGYFVPFDGLVGHEFWHVYDEDAAEWEMGDRAVLLQSIQNYREIAKTHKFRNFPSNDSQVVSDPRFGEQIIVDCNDHDICLGDVYTVSGDSTLKLRVTAPRKSTRELDKKNQTPPGVNGIFHFVTSSSMAGWFCEVLCKGNMAEGDELVLTERPYPKWTLKELGRAVYGGEGDPSSLTRCKPSWGRSEEELEELLEIPYFSECGWKDKLNTIKRHNIERLQHIPYFEKSCGRNNDRANNPNDVASVLGVYERAEDLDEYMPRSQVPSGIFVPVQGMEEQEFYHNYDEDFLETSTAPKQKNSRAVLMQSIQSYRRIMEVAKTSKKFECFPQKEMEILLDPCFGEQIIVDYPTDDICLGDLLAVTGSTVMFRVTSPRKPCSELDNKNDTPYGPKGMRMYTLSSALAGWFCSVETKGEVKKGSTLQLVDRPYPQWPLTEIAKAIYGGEGDPKALARGAGSWGRSIVKLHELLHNPYLADYEWKDELRAILKKRERKANTARAKQQLLLSRLRSNLGLLGPMMMPVVIALLAVIVSFKMLSSLDD